MGSAGVFRPALVRERLSAWTRHPRAGGSRKGIKPANVPIEIWAAVRRPDGTIDSVLWRELQTSIDLAGLYDILEMRDVNASWAHAAMFNQEQNG